MPWPGTCGLCHKQGHVSQDCFKKKPEATSYYQEQVSASDDQDSDGCEAVAFAFITEEEGTPEVNAFNKLLPRPISDSGASHGITCDTNIVSNVKTNTTQVKHVGGHTTPANNATATWKVSTPGGAYSLSFPSCFFDEKLGNQIISEGQATSQGYHIYKSGSLCTYSKDGAVVAICHKTNNIYPFQTNRASCVSVRTSPWSSTATGRLLELWTTSPRNITLIAQEKNFQNIENKTKNIFPLTSWPQLSVRNSLSSFSPQVLQSASAGQTCSSRGTSGWAT